MNVCVSERIFFFNAISSATFFSCSAVIAYSPAWVLSATDFAFAVSPVSLAATAAVYMLVIEFFLLETVL
jgi:hypothetical protein